MYTFKTNKKRGKTKHNIMSITGCWFFEPRVLLTGEETALDQLLGGRVDYDIQSVILSFLDTPPEEASCEEKDGYVDCWDELQNQSYFPVDKDEEHCYDEYYDDDFIICEQDDEYDDDL